MIGAVNTIPAGPFERGDARSARSAVLALGLCACAAAGSDVDPLGQDSVEYAFELETVPTTVVRVSIRVAGDVDGTTRFEAPASWGGVDDCRRFVHAFEVRDASGSSCPVRADAAHGWTAEHEPGALLEARYELRPATPDSLSEIRTRFEPVVRPDLFHLIGDVGLVYPERLDRDRPIDVRLCWVGFRERGWEVVSSFDGEGERLWLPLLAFRHAVFLAGRIRMHERAVPGGRLRVALVGEEWPFADERLVDLVEQVVGLERRFTGDFDDPTFLVTVVPTGARATPQSLSIGGTALRNSLALSLAPGTLLDSDPEHRAQVLELVAHEVFHAWNGNEIEATDAWFSEGFTEFFASRLLRRAGLIDDARWASALDRELRSLWLAPVPSGPADDESLQASAFHRGIVVALVLDEEIRRVSGDRRSIDDFFLEVLDAARAGEACDTDGLLARAARWTSPAFGEALRRTVVDGALPDLPARVSEPPAERFESARIPQYRLARLDGSPR